MARLLYDKIYTSILKKIDPDNEHPEYTVLVARMLAKKVLYGVIFAPEIEVYLSEFLNK